MSSENEPLDFDLESIRAEYNRARKILKGIEELSEHFTKLRSLLDDNNNGVEQTHAWINDKKAKIDAIYASSQEITKQIAGDLGKIKVQMDDMQQAHNSFLELKGTISGKNGEIEELLSTARGLKKDIENAKNSAEQNLQKIATLLGEVQQKMQEMQNTYTSFASLRDKIDDPKNGLQAILNGITDLQGKSQLLFQEIQSFRDESQKLLTTIKSNEKESATLKEKTQQTFEHAQKIADENIDEIKKITALITETGFANAFQEQEKKLSTATYIWLLVFFSTTLILSVALYNLFIGHTDQGAVKILALNPAEILYRLSLTSPLLFIISFAVRQYGRNKDLVDKYAFKAATAGTIKHHIVFLQEKFLTREEDVIVFATETLTKIYKEPYNHTDNSKGFKKLEDQISDLKRAEEKKIDVKEILNSAKELKELFGNDDLLKQTLDFFSKFFGK